MQYLATAILVILTFSLPRRLGIVPLLIAAIHTTQLQVIPNFSILRIIILATLLRGLIHNGVKISWSNRIDRTMIGFIAIIAISSFWHQETVSTNPYTFRARLIIDIFGTYLASKAFLNSDNALSQFGKLFLLILIPLALSMTAEWITGRNFYSTLGANPMAVLRDGDIRASGPFATPILGGTIGALGLPFVALAWASNKRLSRLGLIACLLIIISSASSTPIGAAIIALSSLLFWKFRAKYKPILTTFFSLVFIAQLFRERPIWYLIALVDFVGGSTGWHRSYLIDTAIDHISEWWLFGTDYTRHWMPYGLPSIPEHCDLTNYYIHLGVIGGLPLLICLCFIIYRTFRALNILFNRGIDIFPVWCYTSLFITHSVAFLTISYFDQTFVLFYAPLGMISAIVEISDNSSHESASSSSMESDSHLVD